jgi:hypothetical protein
MGFFNPTGLKIIEQDILPNGTYTLDLKYPALVNMTIRIENSNNITPDTTLNIFTINNNDPTPITFTLTQDRYGVYFNQKPLYQLVATNTSSSITIKLYLEYVVLPYVEPYNEIIQFITTVNLLPAPSITTLYYGANNRYNGTLADATFFNDIPVGTLVAIREINVSSTSSTEVGNVELFLAQNFYYYSNVSPLAATTNTQTAYFKSDTITNNLISSAIQNYANITYMIVDYLFDYNLTVTFYSGYTIDVSGSTTTIVFGGYVYAYYFSDTASEFIDANISSITQSNSSYTLAPTSGLTDSSGQVIINLTQTLDSTTSLDSDTVTASTTIAGISKSAEATLTPDFNFSLAASIPYSSIIYGTAGTSYNLSSSTLVFIDFDVANVGDMVYFISGSTISGGTYEIDTNNTTLSMTTLSSDGSQIVAYGFATKAGSNSVCLLLNPSGGQATNVTAVAVLIANEFIDSSAPFYGNLYNYGSGSPPITLTIPTTSSCLPLPFYAGSEDTQAGTTYTYSITNSTNINTYATELGQAMSVSSINYGAIGVINPSMTYSGVYYPSPSYSVLSLVYTPVTLTITASNGQVLPNQSVTLKLTGTGSTSFSSSSSVRTTTATSDSSGQVNIKLYSYSTADTLTMSSEIAQITNSITL